MVAMKRWMVAGLVLGLCWTGGAVAAPEVEDGWIRLAPPSAPMLAGYARLHNKAGAERRLVAAGSPAFADIELHKTVEEDGVARMIEQPHISIPAGGMRELKPGSYHLMLMRPHAPLAEGEEVTITLTFDNGETREVVFTVREDGSGMRPHEHHDHHSM